MDQSHFERLGLPRRFFVDPAAAEREYLARSRAVHPDFHGRASAVEQRASLEATAALNEAYLTLKNWYRRAEYLLGLLGGPTAQQEKNLDQTFLMEMMDLRERIEEVRSDPAAAREIEAELTTREADIRERVAAEFARVEGLPPAAADRGPRLTAIRRHLNAVKTVRSLLRGLDPD